MDGSLLSILNYAVFSVKLFKSPDRVGDWFCNSSVVIVLLKVFLAVNSVVDGVRRVSTLFLFREAFSI